jgi:hypothetical protein
MTQNIANGTVRSTMRIISTVNAIVAISLLGTSAILFFISFFLGNYPGAVLGLRLAGAGVAFGGIVELIVSIVFRNIYRREKEKLEQLRTTGVSFPAEITRIISRYAVRVGWSLSVYAECTYTNSEGKSCLVKSKSFMHDANFMPIMSHTLAEHPNNHNYAAQVYVNPHDPRDYAVEVYISTGNTQVDHDYR